MCIDGVGRWNFMQWQLPRVEDDAAPVCGRWLTDLHGLAHLELPH